MIVGLCVSPVNRFGSQPYQTSEILRQRIPTVQIDRMNAVLRGRVLSLYRSILRAGRDWTGTRAEKDYIQSEARRQVRENRNVSDMHEIQRLLFEADARLTTGVHYRNPYPRLHNVRPGTTGQSVRERIGDDHGSQDAFSF